MRNVKEGAQPVDYTNMSCAELALVDEQGISINHRIASAAASLLAGMLVAKDLRYHCAYASLDAGAQLVCTTHLVFSGSTSELQRPKWLPKNVSVK